MGTAQPVGLQPVVSAVLQANAVTFQDFVALVQTIAHQPIVSLAMAYASQASVKSH